MARRFWSEILRGHGSKETAARSPRSRCVPLLERLEARLAPATVTWTGGGTNDLWSNAANWDAGVPVTNDIVVIPSTPNSAAVLFDASVPGGGVTLSSVTSDEPFVLSGGTLTVTGNLQEQSGN